MSGLFNWKLPFSFDKVVCKGAVLFVLKMRTVTKERGLLLSEIVPDNFIWVCESKETGRMKSTAAKKEWGKNFLMALVCWCVLRIETIRLTIFFVVKYFIWWKAVIKEYWVNEDYSRHLRCSSVPAGLPTAAMQLLCLLVNNQGAGYKATCIKFKFGLSPDEP